MIFIIDEVIYVIDSKFLNFPYMGKIGYLKKINEILAISPIKMLHEIMVHIHIIGFEIAKLIINKDAK